MTEPADAYELLRKIRYDLTAAQAKVTDALNCLNAMKVPDRPKLECPHCGPYPGGARLLAEHVHVSHGGPLPQHWVDADGLADGG